MNYASINIQSIFEGAEFQFSPSFAFELLSRKKITSLLIFMQKMHMILESF